MFSNALEAELADAIHVVKTSIGGTRIIGLTLCWLVSETWLCYLVYSLVVFTFLFTLFVQETRMDFHCHILEPTKVSLCFML